MVTIQISPTAIQRAPRGTVITTPVTMTLPGSFGSGGDRQRAYSSIQHTAIAGKPALRRPHSGALRIPLTRATLLEGNRLRPSQGIGIRPCTHTLRQFLFSLRWGSYPTPASPGRFESIPDWTRAVLHPASESHSYVPPFTRA